MSQKIACVTGATGLVGQHIVNQLHERGYMVKVLGPQPEPKKDNIAGVEGGLDDAEVLLNFVKGADAVFHCLSETKNPKKMHETNVIGTQNLLKALSQATPNYFCYISNSRVVGRTKAKQVTETTTCSPRNDYEKSIWQAEQLIERAELDTTTVILRPTQVFDQAQTNPISYLLKPSWINRLKIMSLVHDSAQIVHAHNVAAAALYFLDRETAKTSSCERYIVSQDDDPDNSIKQLASASGLAPPVILPRFARIILRIFSIFNPSWPPRHFSAKKLFNTGFTFPLPLKLAVLMAQDEKTPVLTLSQK